jgi:hypothetical protein
MCPVGTVQQSPSFLNSLTSYFDFLDSRGVSHHMLRVGVKRRRSKAEIALEKEAAVRKEALIEQRINKANAME